MKLFLHPRYWLIWLGFGMLRLLAWLPYRPLMMVGRGLGWLLYHLAKRRMHISRVNLKLCFPEHTAEQIECLTKHYAASVGMGLMDFVIAWWWSERRLHSHSRLEGVEHLQAALEKGQGVILLTPHMVSIEMCGRLLAAHVPVMPMYRRHENPLIEHLMKKNREAYVPATIPRDNPRLALRMLQRKQAVWISPDQNYAGKHHVFVDFFGVPAATNTIVSRFATLSGASVVPCVVIRRRSGHYHLMIEPSLNNFPQSPRQDAEQWQKLIERWVRLAPEQYHWMHRRFKTRPDQMPSVY